MATVARHTELPIEIRPAHLLDSEAISEVHSSEVSTWWRFGKGGARTPVPYPELTPLERYANIGPHGDPTILRSHLEQLTGAGQTALVARTNGQIRGEIELFVGEAPGDGRAGHLDVLCVHRDHQRQGIGRALVAAARVAASAADAEYLTVWPEPTAEEFYRNLGFGSVAAELTEIEIPVPSDFPVSDRTRFGPGLRLRGLEPPGVLVLGRYQSSHSQWLKRSWSLPGLEGTPPALEGLLPGGVGVARMRRIPTAPTTLVLESWLRDESAITTAVTAGLSEARRQGMTALHTTIRSPDLSEVPSRGIRELGKVRILRH